MRLFTDAATRVANPHMRRAVRLAESGAGNTAPNPLVGCVIVSDDRIVGEGFHAKAGGPHAEVVALRQAGQAARGATVYVTLEPCDHTGLTPPCTRALIDAEVQSVVIGMPDPTPIAAGGAARLRAAGIDVDFAPDPAPFRQLNEAWLHKQTTGLPYVQVKVALSLDGRPALRTGQTSAISGPGGRDVTMRLRSAADAVAVGVSTALIDDPSLTRRDSNDEPLAEQPTRIVIGRTTVPDTLPTLFSDGHGPALLVLSEAASFLPQPQLTSDAIVTYHGGEGITGALKALGDRGVTHLLIEAGPRLLTALWDGSAFDELVVVHAGGMAGPDAPPAYLGAHDRLQSLDRLFTGMYASEAGVAGEDAVTIWKHRSTLSERSTDSATEGA